MFSCIKVLFNFGFHLSVVYKPATPVPAFIASKSHSLFNYLQNLSKNQQITSYLHTTRLDYFTC